VEQCKLLQTTKLTERIKKKKKKEEKKRIPLRII